PSVTAILTSLPSKGEGISALTLSVTTSTSGSSRLTKSPSCLSHLSTVPSVTDSPSWGILICDTPMARVYPRLKRCPAGLPDELAPAVGQRSALGDTADGFPPQVSSLLLRDRRRLLAPFRQGSPLVLPSLDPAPALSEPSVHVAGKVFGDRCGINGTKGTM